MDPTTKKYQEKAKTDLKKCAKIICKEYTFGWGGPIEWALEKYPYIRPRIADIDAVIYRNGPICVFIERAVAAANMVAVIPYKANSGNPINLRIVPNHEISSVMESNIGKFSDAFWYLLNTEFLPSPSDALKLTKELIKLTHRRIVIA